MLILTHRIGGNLFIGDDNEVVVLEAYGSQVRLGIKSPRDITILREELVGEDREDAVYVTDDWFGVVGGDCRDPCPWWAAGSDA